MRFAKNNFVIDSFKTCGGVTPSWSRHALYAHAPLEHGDVLANTVTLGK